MLAYYLMIKFLKQLNFLYLNMDCSRDFLSNINIMDEDGEPIKVVVDPNYVETDINKMKCWGKIQN